MKTNRSKSAGPISVETRRAVLEAAGPVFAESGYRAATVREICRRAGANVAAVNYHFRDKAGLYLEVLRFTQEEAFRRFPPHPDLPAAASAAERLAAFIRSFLLRVFADGPAAWHGRILLREMVEPTPALDALVRDRLQPQVAQLLALVRELLGPRAAERSVRLSAFSIVSQCCFYHHCRPVIARLFPGQRFAAADIEAIAGHIAAFSLQALKAGRKRRG